MYNKELACEDRDKAKENLAAAQKSRDKLHNRVKRFVVGSMGFLAATTISLALKQKFKGAGTLGQSFGLAGFFVSCSGMLFSIKRANVAVRKEKSLSSRYTAINNAKQRQLIFNKKLQGNNVDATKVLGELVAQLDKTDANISNMYCPIPAERWFDNCEELFVEKVESKYYSREKQNLFDLLRNNAKAMFEISKKCDDEKKLTELVSKKAKVE